MVTHCSMSDDGYPEVFSPSESDKSAGADCHDSDSEPEPPQTSSSSSGSSSISSTDPCDPSLPLPINPQARDSRIQQGLHQPRLVRYQLTAHNGRHRSFLSKWYTTYDWLEYSPVVDKMYCFVCRCFAHRVIGSVGRIDAAFTSSGTQAKRWKNARSVLSKRQSSSIHKQAALCWVDFLAVKPISQQLSREVEASASRKKMHQERN